MTRLLLELLAFGPIEGCLRLPSVSATPDGGVLVHGDDRLDLEGGAGNFTLGLGVAIPLGVVTGEAEARFGAARGQDEFRSAWLPSVTAALGVSLLNNHLIVSVDRRWYRIPHWTQHYASEQEWSDEGSLSKPDGAATQWRWKRFKALTLGFRF